jgi:predicted acyl esterase
MTRLFAVLVALILSWNGVCAENKQTVHVAMRDGVKLATDVYLPEGSGPFPVLLSRTPYGRVNHGGGAAGLVRAGVVCVVQDMRGRFDSEGENIPFIGCGWGEHQDGMDTLAWLRKQPWCNGKIGTIGGSAGGITQNLLAGAATNGVTAQYISVAAASLYHDIVYTGGALRKADVENWTTQNKFDPKALLLMREHPSYDDYWRQFDTALKFSVMTAPAVHVGGWFDMFAQGTIDEFVGRQHHGGPGARGRQKLVMGPWEHGVGKENVGDLVFPNSRPPKGFDSGRWFEFFLLGRENGVLKQPAVAYYVMGDTSTTGAPGNTWRFANDWPVPATDTRFYFQRDGKLSTTKPATESGSVTYTFDPADPCPTIGGGNLTIPRGPRNQNPIESRSDVVLFTTEPLTEPIEVTGRVKANIFVESSAADTDLSVRLCDVYPDGKSYMMAEGMLRLRHRNSFEKPEPLTRGKVEQVTVDCWSTSIIFNKGHRIRVTVTSSNYPRFDLNPGTGKAWTDDGGRVRQTNRIFCDAIRPSCVILPRLTDD